MNAAKTIEAQEPSRPKYVIACVEEGCASTVTGVGNNALQARHDANRNARENGWDCLKKDVFRCPTCRAAFVRADSERKVILRADKRKAEEKRIREAKKDAAARRATRPVGEKTAKADVTLTKETPKLIHRTNFERYVYGKLDGPQKNAADHLASLIEAAAGVSDKELYQEKTDGGANNFEPSTHQLDALKVLREARQAVGPHLYDVADHAIIQDAVPARVGARYSWLTNDRDRAMVGTVMIRVALNALAAHWGMG